MAVGVYLSLLHVASHPLVINFEKPKECSIVIIQLLEPNRCYCTSHYQSQSLLLALQEVKGLLNVIRLCCISYYQSQ